MKDIFPAEGTTVIVSNDMCDMNGHMNMRFYQTIPLDYDGNFYTSLGFGEDYFARGFSSFTVEQNIRYLKECLKDEKLIPRFRMLNVNRKLYHFVCAILKETDEVAALIETVEIHINMFTRKSAEMSDEIFEAMVKIQEEHSSFSDYPFKTKLKIK